MLHNDIIPAVAQVNPHFFDLRSVTPQNMSLGIDGEYWINTCRHKTDPAYLRYHRNAYKWRSYRNRFKTTWTHKH